MQIEVARWNIFLCCKLLCRACASIAGWDCGCDSKALQAEVVQGSALHWMLLLPKNLVAVGGWWYLMYLWYLRNAIYILWMCTSTCTCVQLCTESHWCSQYWCREWEPRDMVSHLQSMFRMSIMNRIMVAARTSTLTIWCRTYICAHATRPSWRAGV